MVSPLLPGSMVSPISTFDTAVIIIKKRLLLIHGGKGLLGIKEEEWIESDL